MSKFKNEVAVEFEKHLKKYKGVADKVTRAEMAISQTSDKFFQMADYQIRACIRFPHLSIKELSKNWK